MSKSGRFAADITQPTDDPSELISFFMLTHCPYFSNKNNTSLSAEHGGYPDEAIAPHPKGPEGWLLPQINTD